MKVGWKSLSGFQSHPFPVLEEEGLEDRVSSLEAFWGGDGREKAHLSGQNWGLRF